MDAGSRAIELLRCLIRFDTTNPPGRERTAQEHMRGVLDAAGFRCELLGPERERPNLVARLRGRSDGPTLCLLGHMDTVAAAAARWSADPWSGELRDGCVWGRGAIDMKSQVAAQAIAAVSLVEQGWRPAAGDLLIVVTVDEETGGAAGARWLCNHAADKVRCDMVVNEGGGMALELGGRRLYGVGVGEKGVFRLTISTEARGGHAAVPGIGENALVKLWPLLAALAGHRPVLEATPEAGPLLEQLGYPVAGALDAAFDRLRSEHAEVAALLEPGFSVTLAPTMVRASDRANVLPGLAELGVDCRAPAGFGEAEVRTRLEEAIGTEGYTLRWDRRSTGTRSPAESPLMDAIIESMGTVDPDGEVVARLFCGFSDSHWFRAAFRGCVTYGFFPQRSMPETTGLALMHAIDERIPVEDMHLATRFYADLVPRLLG